MLASRYVSYALSEENDEKRELWKKLNALNMQKPLITIHQVPWQEMDVDGFFAMYRYGSLFSEGRKRIAPTDLFLGTYAGRYGAESLYQYSPTDSQYRVRDLYDSGQS